MAGPTFIAYLQYTELERASSGSMAGDKDWQLYCVVSKSLVQAQRKAVYHFACYELSRDLNIHVPSKYYFHNNFQYRESWLYTSFACRELMS